MGSLLNRIYEKYSAKDFILLAKKLDTIEWIVEAGIHDGTDTEILLKTFDVNHYFAFEPDPAAFAFADAKLSEERSKHNLMLLPIALSDRKHIIKMVSPKGFGLGISQITNDPHSQGVLIQSDLLDNYLASMNNNGLLWLDVEGHSISALNGSIRNLNKFVICKIEAQTHTIDSRKEQDAFRVHKLMRKNFLLIRAPLYPGYFGDLVYLRKDQASMVPWISSKALTVVFYALHRIIYPLLKKPK